MGSISLRNLGVTATDPLFSNLNFVIADGDRVGLVAGNGNGKTTLLRIIAGLAEPSEGDVVRSRGLQIGYVEQDVPAHLHALTLRQAIGQAMAPEERENESWRIEVVLDEFETPDDLRDRQVAKLSGGWQRLMLIARIWVTQPDALLLDEPTNHLDLTKLAQLEAWVGTTLRTIPVIIASHDRDFLDATTNRTLFLRPGTSHYFGVPYSHARKELAQMDAADEAKLERDMRDARQLRKQAAKLTNIGINSGSDLLTSKAKQLKDRAARIEEAARPPHRERSGDIRLANSGTHAKVLLAMEDLWVSTPAGQNLFRIDKLHLFQGERLVLLGRNGAGKSQFVKLVKRAIEGEADPGVRVSPSVVLGYTDQDMSQLPVRGTPAEFINGTFDIGNQRTTALLAAAGFSVERQGKPIATLSFGQRARLGLLALRLAEPNFYLMDEPTNHVDIAGQERLEEEIIAHEATTILVSHDRSFVRAIGTRFLLIDGKRLREVEDPEAFFAEMAKG